MNRGATPPDATTPVGSLRLSIGDTTSVPLDPPVAGFADYDYFSDDELAVFITRGTGNLSRAQGFAILQLSLGAGLSTEKSIRTDDLAIDKKGGAKSLLEIAREWFARADAEDLVIANADFYFDVIVPC